MSWKSKDWLKAIGILGATAAAVMSGGAAAPALAGALGAGEAAAGAGALGAGALATETAGGLAAGAGAAGAAGAGAAGLAGAAETAGALGAATAAPGAAGAFGAAANVAPSTAGILADLGGMGGAAGAAAPGAAQGAAAASPGLLNASDLAFTGSKLYNPAVVGQTTPMSFQGMPGAMDMVGQAPGVVPQGAKPGMQDMVRLANSMRGRQQQQPQMMRTQAPFQQPQDESFQDQYKQYMKLVDPVTYKLIYGNQ